MRSRYSAHIEGNVDYILDTYLPEQRAKLSREDIELSTKNIQWCGLDVIDAPVVNQGDEHGVVEFQAKYMVDGRAQILHERSSFQRLDGKWFYVTGNLRTRSSKVGRNEPCPCGSGKKYKKCCLNTKSV
jgi:SEC-C motif-containing protein